MCSVLLLLLLGTLIIICNLVIICGFVCFTPVVPVCRVMEAETPSTSLTIVYLGISMRSGSEHLLDKNMHVINFWWQLNEVLDHSWRRQRWLLGVQEGWWWGWTLNHELRFSEFVMILRSISRNIKDQLDIQVLNNEKNQPGDRNLLHICTYVMEWSTWLTWT